MNLATEWVLYDITYAGGGGLIWLKTLNSNANVATVSFQADVWFGNGSLQVPGILNLTVDLVSQKCLHGFLQFLLWRCHFGAATNRRRFGLAISCWEAGTRGLTLSFLVHHITKFPIVELVVARLVELFKGRLNLQIRKKWTKSI